VPLAAVLRRQLRQFLVIVADILGQGLELLQLQVQQPVVAEVVDLTQLQQVDVAPRVQPRGLEVADQVHVRDPRVVDEGAPASAVDPVVAHRRQPAVRVRFIGEVIGVLLVVGDVAAAGLPLAVPGVEIAPEYLVVQATPADVARRVGEVVVRRQVHVDRGADVHATAAVGAEGREQEARAAAIINGKAQPRQVQQGHVPGPQGGAARDADPAVDIQFQLPRVQ
jgi:hypothetical protein